MQSSRRRVPVLGILGAILLGIAAVSAFFGLAWRIEDRYALEIGASTDLDWTLWLPAPDRPVSATTSGAVALHGTVDTPHGPLWNVTGRGAARILVVVSDLVISLQSDPFQVHAPMNISSHEGQGSFGGFWAWRSTSNTSASVSVSGGLSWEATRLGDEWGCGGPDFVGGLDEGWTFLSEGFGDCTILSGPPAVAVAGVVGALGGILILTEWRRRAPREP